MIGVGLSIVQLAVRQLLGGTFSPIDLFTTGVTGAWYDPSDTTTLFSDAAGTQPVTAVEQTVGLMLDKSKGLVLGPELVTNGDFSSGSTGWSLPSQWQVINQQLSFVGGAGQNATQVCGIVNGRTYEITFTIIACANFGAAYIAVGGVAYLAFSSLGITSTGTKKIIVSASGTDGHILFRGLDAITYTIDNISVRELPGNHAFNSSGNSANFPVLSARYNLLTKTEQFDDAVWVKYNIRPFGSGSISNTTETLDPFGGNTADKIVSIASTALTAVEQNKGEGQPSTPSTFSTYVKAAGCSRVQLLWKSQVASRYANFNLSNGLATAGNSTSSTITSVGNDWYRISITDTTTGAWAFVSMIDNDAAPYGATYTGDGTSGIYIWGADLRVANDALNQPAYQRVNTGAPGVADYDTTGFKPYLRFNDPARGTNNWLQTNSIDFTSTDKMFVSAGVRRLIDSACVISELSADWNSNNGSFLYWGGSNHNGTGNAFNSGSRGTSAASSNQFGYTQSAFTPPVTAVVSANHDIAGSLTVVRGNGAAGAKGTGSKGTGNFGNYPLYIGARAGTSLWFNGRLYQMVVAGKQASASEISSTETYLNQKTGAF